MDNLEEMIMSIAKVQHNATKSGYTLGYETGFAEGKIAGLEEAMKIIKKGGENIYGNNETT